MLLLKPEPYTPKDLETEAVLIHWLPKLIRLAGKATRVAGAVVDLTLTLKSSNLAITPGWLLVP